MRDIQHIILPILLSFIGTLWMHPKILKIAILKNIVDNPDARKLQRNPVPVMGGIAVFFGIVIGLCSSHVQQRKHLYAYIGNAYYAVCRHH